MTNEKLVVFIFRDRGTKNDQRKVGRFLFSATGVLKMTNEKLVVFIFRDRGTKNDQRKVGHFYFPPQGYKKYVMQGGTPAQSGRLRRQRLHSVM